MASSMDKLAKELKKQITASDERKPKPYDTQAEVLRVENGVAWVHIPGGVDETPVRLTINAKKGDNVNLHVANGTAWITGNSTNPPTDDSTANYAVNISNEVKKDVTVLNNIVVDEIEATNARFTNVEADTAKIHDLTADNLHATVGYIEDLTADSITANDISAASGYIKDLEADNITANDISAASGYIKDLEAENITAQDITADHATVGSLDANYAHITNGVIDNAKIGYADVNGLNANYAHVSNGTIDNAKIGHADVNGLNANYAHINNGVIDNAKINYADVNNLNANYAQINLANVNNAWIENGVVKDAAISDAQILGVSANKLTAGTIDASNITVTNLNASNITTGSITVDGITIDVENNEASIDGEYIEDGTITLNGLAQEVTDKIDGAIETFTGSAVPTLNNYPASSWTTTKIKDSHIGDVYYVLNTENTADGYCYRFAKDGNTYKWILIKDSDVTAALSRLTTAEGKISGLESFESTTSSWITNTDEELSSIKSNHTSLVTVVNKTVKETVQLWFTKANTTAPSKPTAQVTNNSPTGSNSYNKWNLAVPQYNSSYPNYYYCYQWKYADGTYGWSAVTRDIAMGESQSTARTAASDASTAVSTAETASTNASNAVSTANTASTNASTALSTANTANTNASTALSTANTAASDASSAVSTANTANSNASSAVTTANAAQTTANANIKSSVQLWFTKANTTAPSKPTAHVTTNDASKANRWNIAVPTYNGTYPNYFYCYEYQKGDGTYAWSNVVYDRATTENQSNSRSALSQVATKVETSTFNTLSQTVDSNTANITSLSNVVETKADSSTVTTLSNTVNEVSQTATGNSSKISNLTQTFGTNADGTTKAGDIVHRTSAVEQDLSGFKTTVSKTYHKTSDFNTYKAANDTAVAAAKKAGDDAQADLDEYKGTVSETYATKSSLTQTAEGIRTDVSSTYETKTDASAKLTEAKGDATTKANKALTDAKADTTNKLKSYYTKTETDSAITQKAGEISLSVAQTEISKIEVGGRNLLRRTKTYEGWEKTSSITLTQDKEGITVANWPQVSTASWRDIRSSGGEELLIPYSLVRDREVTLSCWFKMDAIPTSDINGILFVIFDLNDAGTYTGNRKKYTANVFSGKIKQTTDWQRVVWTGTISDALFVSGTGTIADTDLFYMQIYNHNLPATHVKKVKLEYGNRATDWSPAPEDLEAYTDSQVSAAKAEIKVTTDGISTEVEKKTDKSTIISTIRQSAETVKIKASQVEINGTATFNAIKSSTDAAYDAKGAASAAESNAKDYADGAVADKADKSNAVARTQRIYYRKTSSGAPSANKTWLATSGTGYGNWSLKVPQMTSGTTKYPYLYTAVQTQTVAQMAAGNACSCSAVLLDDTTTVIDGGHITTGTIDSNRLNADTIKVNAANIQGSLTIGQLPSTVAETSDIPTKVSELSNDSGYQTASDVSGAIVSTTTLYYASNSTTAPNKPTAHVTTNSASTRGAWNIALPAYNASYPYLYVCTETKTKGGAYAWTSVEQTTYASAISAIKTTADGAAPKSSAIAEEQRIYYRSNSSTKPNGNGLPTTWVTETGDKYNTNATTSTGWSKKVTPIANGTGSSVTKYLYLWTCIQKKTVDGTVTYGDILLDDSTTVIDGGKIVTGSVSANKIKVSEIEIGAAQITSGTIATARIPDLSAGKITAGDISADRMKVNSIAAINSLTTGKIDAARINVGQITVGSLSDGSSYSTTTQMKKAIGNAVDGIDVGGRNLLLDSEAMSSWYTASGTSISGGVATLVGSSSNWDSNLSTKKYDASLYDGQTTYTLSFEYKSSMACNFLPVIAGTAQPIDNNSWARTKYAYWAPTFTVPSSGGEWAKFSLNPRTIAISDLTSGSGDVINGYLQLYCRTDNVNLQIRHFKLEKGNKATDWTPAPEDVQAEIDAVDTKADGANSQEQRIYYRSNSTTAPTAPSTWVTSTSTANATWSTKRMQYDSTYKYLYTCIQRKTVGGTITNSTVLLDDTTTVIDGGNIITGSVTANQLSANAVTADKIAIGAIEEYENILLDSDAPTLTKVKASYDRYWADSSNNKIVCSNFSLTDAPEQGLNYGRRFVYDGSVATNNYLRSYAFYNNGTNNSIPLVPNQTYTATWWARCTSGSGRTQFCYSKGDGATGAVNGTTYTLTSYWKKYTHSFTYGSALNTNYNRIWFRALFPTSTAGTVEICGCKLTVGDDAESYITRIDSNGIRIHPSSTENNSVVINSNGMEVFKGGTTSAYSVAKYGDSARIGKESGSHLTLASDSMSMSDGTKDVFNLLQKTMYIYWNQNYKGRQFANSTDRYVDSWETGTTISTWDSITVNYKLNNTSRTKKIMSISNGVLANDEIYVHFNYSGRIITLTYGRGSSAASSDIIKLESAVVYYVTDEKVSQLHTGTYPNTTVSGALRIGNGTSDSDRRNLMLVDWSGTGKFKGDILAFCGADSSGGMSLTKAEENIDAFKYEDANGHVYINAYRVGRIVSLLCNLSKTLSIAPGGDLYRLDLTNAHLPKPLGTNTSGTGISSKNMIIGNIYYNKTVTPNKYEFICRNGGSTAMSTGGVGFTITYICQMDEVSGEIKYMDD